MRILMVSDFYPPVIGGLERHVRTLSRELARRGHEVAVATLWHEGAPAFERGDDGVRVYRLGGWSRALTPLYDDAARHFHPTVPDPGVVAGLRRVVARERPEVVHARGWMLYSFLPLKAWSGARLVVTLHDYSLVCPKKTYVRGDIRGDKGGVCQGPAFAACLRCAGGYYGPLKGTALTAALRLSGALHDGADRYIAISEAVRAASRGATRRPIEVVPTFIPDAVLDEDPGEERPAFLPPRDGYILFVGALGPHKGLDVLLAAYTAAGLRDRAPLVVVGTGRPDTPTHFPNGVTVARDIPHAAVMAAWARCAVGVVPSVWPEPFGQVALEAMARGRPVVASAVGGLRDAVVDGETGLLVPPGDPDALGRALRALLDDPARRARMGAAGRRRAALFTASAVTGRIERIYAEALLDR